MKKLVILLVFISTSLISKSQNPNPYPERYVPTVSRTKYELPLWLYNGAYLSAITKKSNQMQVLVRDSVTQLIGYKYISSTVDTINMTYSAPLRRNGNAISVPLTKNSNMNRVLVQDSVTGYFSYKYLTAATTYSAGRGLTLGGATFRLDTTKQYRFTNGLIMGGNLVLGSATYTLYTSGNATLNDIYSFGMIGATSLLEINGKSRIYSAADGRFNLTNQANTGFTRLAFGLENTSFPSLQVNGKKLVTMLGDGSATSNFQVKDTIFSSVWNGQIDVPTKNAVYDQMILKVNYTDTATMLSKYLRSADTLKLHNQVAARVKYSDTATMLSKYLRSADTLKLHNQVAARVKYTDTAAMLSPYVLESKVYSGTYSPSASDLQNITSVSFTNCGTRYMRINNQVTVTGAATVSITSSSTLASFELTLPIASTLTTGLFTDIAGVVTGAESPLQGVVTAENNHAQITWGSTGLVAGTYSVNYTYSYTIN